jgi:hypothetical protein
MAAGARSHYRGLFIQGRGVEQPARFLLIFNLKTAQAIGIMVPQSFRLHADEVIQ